MPNSKKDIKQLEIFMEEIVQQNTALLERIVTHLELLHKDMDAIRQALDSLNKEDMPAIARTNNILMINQQLLARKIAMLEELLDYQRVN